MRWLVVALVVAACGSGRSRDTTTSKPQTPVAERAADWILPLLPEGAQLLVEVDLARLRGNPVAGELVASLLGELGAEAKLPGLPMAVQGSPLASADMLVLAGYGVGTPDAATLSVLVTKGEVTGGVRIAADLVALGPDTWVDQIASRAAIASLYPDAPAPVGERLTLTASPEMMRLREHAMPPKAPGASIRVTARLTFDARVALAQLLGLEAAPAQLSIWADVVDDFAIIIDVDAADPGDRDVKSARKRVGASLAKLLLAVANEPAVRAIGLSPNIADARVVEQGTWVRAIISVGPRQLKRVVERARAMLAPAP